MLDWQANQRLPFPTVEALKKYPVKFPESTGNNSIRIYALLDPRDRTVRWLGFTSKKVPGLPRSTNPEMASWVSELHREGLTPSVVILDQVAPEWRPKATESWMAYARNLGRLYNYTDQVHGPRKAKRKTGRRPLDHTPKRRGAIDCYGIYRRNVPK